MTRHFLLIFAFLSLPGWSQPSPQQAEPPIVVQVQMPPTNPWMHILELVVPGIIGAGLALLGVWLTNKHNRMLNKTNHQYETEKWDRQTRWTAKKEKYETLTADLSTLSSLPIRYESAKRGGTNKGDEFQRLLDHSVVITRNAKVTRLFAGVEVSQMYRAATEAFAIAVGCVERHSGGTECKDAIGAFSGAEDAFIAAPPLEGTWVMQTKLTVCRLPKLFCPMEIRDSWKSGEIRGKSGTVTLAPDLPAR